MTEHSLNKGERLKSRSIITELFRNGNSVFVYPIKLVYTSIHSEHSPSLYSNSVPKRAFKKAVTRNKIKRHLREAFRLNKKDLNVYLTNQDKQIALMYIYVSKNIDDVNLLDTCTKKLHKKLISQLEKENIS